MSKEGGCTPLVQTVLLGVVSWFLVNYHCNARFYEVTVMRGQIEMMEDQIDLLQHQVKLLVYCCFMMAVFLFILLFARSRYTYSAQ